GTTSPAVLPGGQRAGSPGARGRTRPAVAAPVDTGEMSMHPPGPDLVDLFRWFPPRTDLPTFQLLPGVDVPEPLHGLLCHEHQTTVAVEDYHRDTVDVRLLAVRQRDPYYSRKIILTTRRTGKVVLFGIVRVNLDFTTAPVRAAILEGEIP